MKRTFGIISTIVLHILFVLLFVTFNSKITVTLKKKIPAELPPISYIIYPTAPNQPKSTDGKQQKGSITEIECPKGQTYKGIGLISMMMTGEVLAVAPNSPASDAGITIGDIYLNAHDEADKDDNLFVMIMRDGIVTNHTIHEQTICMRDKK